MKDVINIENEELELNLAALHFDASRLPDYKIKPPSQEDAAKKAPVHSAQILTDHESLITSQEQILNLHAKVCSTLKMIDGKEDIILNEIDQKPEEHIKWANDFAGKLNGLFSALQDYCVKNHIALETDSSNTCLEIPQAPFKEADAVKLLLQNLARDKALERLGGQVAIVNREHRIALLEGLSMDHSNAVRIADDTIEKGLDVKVLQKRISTLVETLGHSIENTKVPLKEDADTFSRTCACSIALKYIGVFYRNKAHFKHFIDRLSKFVANPLTRTGLNGNESELCPYAAPSIIAATHPFYHGPAVTYADINLEPRKCVVASRRDVDLSIALGGGKLILQLPIMNSPMKSIDSPALVTCVSRQGGLGVFSREVKIPKQVERVAKVKSEPAVIASKPITVGLNETMINVKSLIKGKKCGNVLVVTPDQKLCGIITESDIIKQENLNGQKVKDFVNPEATVLSLEQGDQNLSIDVLKRFLQKNQVSKIPIVNNTGEPVGIVVDRDLTLPTLDSQGRLAVAAAVGIKYMETEIRRLHALIEAGADLIIIDAAHLHGNKGIEMTQTVRKLYPNILLCAGNIASIEGARALAPLVDILKVGIGPGSVCTTRVMTGFGVPQLSALNLTKVGKIEAYREDQTLICADGGLVDHGDFAKAFGAGKASIGMSGSFFAGFRDIGEKYIEKDADGKEWMCYSGSASEDGHENYAFLAAQNGDADQEYRVNRGPEGAIKKVPVRENLVGELYDLEAHLQSAVSYGGCASLREFIECEEVATVRGTASSSREAGAHFGESR